MNKLRRIKEYKHSDGTVSLLVKNEDTGVITSVDIRKKEGSKNMTY